MEEADLLKERLQAITDKRKLQEDIAKKKLEIEQEKLKLQYLKKKSLREQWLMDGLSPPSEQEQEAMKLQALDDQQQSMILQSSIHRMEKEIAALERQETILTTNEALILKRLKEVEKTADDIIKAVNADIQSEPIQYVRSAVTDTPKSFSPSRLKTPSPKLNPNTEEPKQALFAMEINVEKDMKTGKSQILSTAAVTAENLPHNGIKVYDDGRKSVYAVHSDAQKVKNGVAELTSVEVEELLKKATEKRLQVDVEYHEPVFSCPYSRPSTPKRRDLDQMHPESASQAEEIENVIPTQPEIDNNKATLLKDEMKQEVSNIPLHLPKSMVKQYLPELPRDVQNTMPMSRQTCPFGKVDFDGTRWSSALTTEGDGAVRTLGSSLTHQDHFPVYPEISKLNILNTMPENIASSNPVTMIFMGYQHADNEEEAGSFLGDEGVVQAELVVISDGDDHGQDVQLSYHPDGCRSKVFQPKTNTSFKADRYLNNIRSIQNKNNALSYATVQDQGQQSMLSHVRQSSERIPDGTEEPSATGIDRRKKHSCFLTQRALLNTNLHPSSENALARTH